MRSSDTLLLSGLYFVLLLTLFGCLTKTSLGNLTANSKYSFTELFHGLCTYWEKIYRRSSLQFECFPEILY